MLCRLETVVLKQFGWKLPARQRAVVEESGWAQRG